jgi:hypothetical protein
MLLGPAASFRLVADPAIFSNWANNTGTIWIQTILEIFGHGFMFEW